MDTRLYNNRHFSIIKNKNIFDHTRLTINGGMNGRTVIIPHVCNNINLFGAGFAKQISDYYPIVKANFHLLGNKSKLGTIQFVVADIEKKYNHKIIFANMIAQNKTIGPNNKRPLNYAALVCCMNQIKSYIKDLEKSPEISKIEIHSPKFGSGLAGGNWNFISDLIEDIWNDIPVYIYNFLPTPTNN